MADSYNLFLPVPAGWKAAVWVTVQQDFSKFRKTQCVQIFYQDSSLPFPDFLSNVYLVFEFFQISKKCKYGVHIYYIVF